MSEVHKHTFSVLVENKFGVLSRIVGLFSGRGYNIASLTVNATENPEVSMMTIVTCGDDAVLEQIEKQLTKLIDVISVEDLAFGSFVERELALIRVGAVTPEKRAAVCQLAEIFNAQIVSVTRDDLTLEISGRPERLDNLIELLRDYGILRLARSGRVAVSSC